MLLPSPKIKLAVFWLDSSWSSRQDFCLVRQQLDWAFLLPFFFFKTNGRLAFLGREGDRITFPLQIGVGNKAFLCLWGAYFCFPVDAAPVTSAIFS